MTKKENLTPEKGTEQEELTPEDENPKKVSGSEEIETEPKEPEKEPEKPPKPKVDYKEKFANSTRENQILRGKIDELESRLGIITKDETPTDKEMKELYPDWDEMMELERKLAINQFILERRLNKTSLAVQDMAAEKEWNEKLDQFLEKADILDEFPELKGREKEFKEFAKKPTHKGVDLNIIARAFLYNPEKEPEKIETKPVLEPGSGGPKKPEKLGFTDEEIKLMREKDPKRYNLLVKQGKIKVEI